MSDEGEEALSPNSLREIRKQKQLTLRARMAARKDSQKRLTNADGTPITPLDTNDNDATSSNNNNGDDGSSGTTSTPVITITSPGSSSLTTSSGNEVKSALSPTGRRKSTKSVKVVSPSETHNNNGSLLSLPEGDDTAPTPTSEPTPRTTATTTTGGKHIRASKSAEFDSKRPASTGAAVAGGEDTLPELTRQTSSAAEKRARVKAKQQQSRSLSQYAGSLLVNNAKTRNNATMKLQNLTLKLGNHYLLSLSFLHQRLKCSLTIANVHQ
jgi:hypothetical protein